MVFQLTTELFTIRGMSNGTQYKPFATVAVTFDEY